MSIVTCKYWIHVLCIFLKIKSDLHRMLGKSSVKSHHEKVSEQMKGITVPTYLSQVDKCQSANATPRFYLTYR